MNLKMVLLSYFDVKFCFDTLKQIELKSYRIVKTR